MQKKIFLLTAICLFITAANVFAEGEAYIYDRWSEIEHSPDSYRVEKVYLSRDIGEGKQLSSPSGLFCRDNQIYICDYGNNRIIQCRYNEDRTVEVERIIDSFNSNGAVIETFNGPSDVYVAKDGTIYVADTNNSRVVKLTQDLDYLLQFTSPTDPTYDQTLSYLPIKVVADVSGRAYVIAKNVNKGFVKYEADGTFTNFWGASEVNPNALDLLWKKLSSTKQRERMESFVPTEFSNVYEDREGFLYATIKTFDQWKLLSDKAKPIRRLNALGSDILIKNAKVPPIGDLQWNSGKDAVYAGPSRFEDITVLDNDIYLALDGTRGRIFAYNNQGYLLFAFGGMGNNEGFFKYPVAIDHIGRDLMVLDSKDCSLTVFSPTYFGNLVYDALELYATGFYNESAEVWEKVLLLNGNYDLAYVGIGKAALRNDDYKKAMENFAHKKDAKQYSKAYVLYRKEWFEKNLGWMFAVVFVIAIVVLVLRKIKRMKMEVALYELSGK